MQHHTVCPVGKAQRLWLASCDVKMCNTVRQLSCEANFPIGKCKAGAKVVTAHGNKRLRQAKACHNDLRRSHAPDLYAIVLDLSIL